MTDFELDRLNRYIDDAQHWLLVISEILSYPETTSQAAAASMARAAIELVAGVHQQILLDSNMLTPKTKGGSGIHV